MSGPSSIVVRITAELEPHGILARGSISFGSDDGPQLADGSQARSIVLLGNVGGSIWPAFSRWRETHMDPDPLDAWSRQLIGPLAEELGATAYFPSDPPWQPFQRWAMMAEGLKPSPLGILIHPVYGLWHGYRGALGFPFEIVNFTKAAGHPCDCCVDRPCLKVCPVDAIVPADFRVATCRSYLAGEEGRKTCMAHGCLARNVCPVGAAFRYSPEQLRFHMEALT